MEAVTTIRVVSRYAGEIEIEGKLYKIRKLDGIGWAQLKAARAKVLAGSSEDSVEDTFAIASRLIVGLSPEQVIGTEAEPGLIDRNTALDIVALAGRGIEAVEAELGKDAGAPPP